MTHSGYQGGGLTQHQHYVYCNIVKPGVRDELPNSVYEINHADSSACTIPKLKALMK